MARSLKKEPFIEESLENKINKANDANSKKLIQTYSRRSVIIPEMVGLNIAIHNGKVFIPLYITESMVGHKLGEFAPTRSFRSHKVAGGKR